MEAIGHASCPGTCGEWVQGVQNNTFFLVDSPINRFAEVEVKLVLNNNNNIKFDIPSSKKKVIKALNLIEETIGFKLSGQMNFISDLPIGKGMASSTADIVAACASTVKALGKTPVPEYLLRIALAVEPSDSVMFPGITEIDHIHGSYVKNIGQAPLATFIALDWGGAIDTIYFNARHDLIFHYKKNEQEVKKALQLVREGIYKNDLEKIAFGGTISANCNLEINPKPQFKTFHQWILKNGGLGIITAHSGTLLAGVFPPGSFQQNLVSEAEEIFKPSYIDVFQSYNGGIK